MFVGYYRVSTREQGRSGLGLEAQKAAVNDYVRMKGALLAEFTEIESGGVAGRPQLNAALDRCRRSRGTLVIARLDRLARNVLFISQLMESGVEFVAVDMPSANKLTLHIIAAIAEHERDLISARTRAALAAAKGRGIKLGNPGIHQVRHLGVEKRVVSADDFARRTYPMICAIKRSGVATFASVAKALNAANVPTQRSRMWTPAGVRNLVLRATSLGLDN